MRRVSYVGKSRSLPYHHRANQRMALMEYDAYGFDSWVADEVIKLAEAEGWKWDTFGDEKISETYFYLKSRDDYKDFMTWYKPTARMISKRINEELISHLFYGTPCNYPPPITKE